MMILVDTNILSTFGKAGGMKLLFELFQTKLSVSSNVFCEISIAYEKGYSFA
jgi:predicted nucleic acid-binding protein